MKIHIKVEHEFFLDVYIGYLHIKTNIYILWLHHLRISENVQVYSYLVQQSLYQTSDMAKKSTLCHKGLSCQL